MEKNRSSGNGNQSCENIDSLLCCRSNVVGVSLVNGTLSKQIVVGNNSVSNVIDKETRVARSETKIGNNNSSSDFLKLLLSDRRTKIELVRHFGSVAQFDSFTREMYTRFASASQRCPLMKVPTPNLSVPREMLCEFLRAFMRIGFYANSLALPKKQARCTTVDVRKTMFSVLPVGDLLKFCDDNDRSTNSSSTSSNRTVTQFVADDFRSPKRKRAATPEQQQQCRVASWTAAKRKRYCGKLQTVPWSDGGNAGGNAGGSCGSAGGSRQRDYDSTLEYQLLDSSSSPSTSAGCSGGCSPYTITTAKDDAVNERDSEMFDEENYASSTNETLTVDDEDYEPSEDDTESSLLSYESFDDDEDPTKRRSVLRIYHTYRDSYNREHTRLEVTRNRAIIDYYMKIMSKKGKRKVEREKSKDCSSTDTGRLHCASQSTVPIVQRVVQSDAEESLTRNYYQRRESNSGASEYVNVAANNDCSSVRTSNVSGTVGGYCDDDDDDVDVDVDVVVEKKRKRARERRVSSTKSQKTTTEERCCADGLPEKTTDEQRPKNSAESEEDEYFAMERLTSRLIAIWDEIDIQSNGQPYRFPIDAEKEPKYYRMVKSPMSLAAMLDNLNNRLYQDRVSFLSDVDQITRNSEVYYDETNKICIFYAQVILQTCVTRLIEYDEELTKCERTIDPLSSADNNRRFVLSVVLRSILRKIKEMPEIEEYLKLLSERPPVVVDAASVSVAEQDSNPILDLDLIENRIYSCVYSSRTEFLTDLQIMHIDCATVHGPESVHAQNAQIVFNMFCANFEVYGSILQLLENKFNKTATGHDEKRALSPQSMMSSSPLLSPPLLSPQLISPEPLSPRPLSPQPLSPGGNAAGGSGGRLFNVDSPDEYSDETRYKKIKLAVDRRQRSSGSWSLEQDSYVSDADDECTNDACPPRFQKFYALNRDSATAATEIIIEREQIDSDPEQQAQLLLSASATRKDTLPNHGDHRPKEFRNRGRSADCCRPISPIFSELEEFIKVDKLVSTTNKR